MKWDADQVERIVREVIGRLRSQDAGREALRTPDSMAPGIRTETALDPAAATRSASEPPAGKSGAAPILLLADRLVTMASVSGRLEGIQCVQVHDRAIVTPLVIDQLRERGIQLTRQSSSTRGDVASRSQVLLSLSADENQTRRVAPLLDAIAPGWNSLVCGESTLSEILRSTANRRLLVFTEQWASLVCQVNRHRQLRASVASSVSMVEQACQQVDINVLVIDSARLTDPQLHELIRQYVNHAQRRVTAA